MHMKLATVIKSGNYLEAKTYDPPIPIQRGSSRRSSFISAPYTSKNHEQHKQQAINRAKRKLRRLIECNFDQCYNFTTLTFANHVNDIVFALKKLDLFCRKISRDRENKNLSKFKYIYVIEFQKNGRVHFHMLTNLCDYPSKLIESFWNDGYIQRQFVKSHRKDNEKIWRYMTKNFGDGRLIGKRYFVASKGLKKPIETNYEDEAMLEVDLKQLNAKLYHSKEVNYGFGSTKYEEYYTD